MKRDVTLTLRPEDSLIDIRMALNGEFFNESLVFSLPADPQGESFLNLSRILAFRALNKNGEHLFYYLQGPNKYVVDISHEHIEPILYIEYSFLCPQAPEKLFSQMSLHGGQLKLNECLLSPQDKKFPFSCEVRSSPLWSYLVTDYPEATGRPRNEFHYFIKDLSSFCTKTFRFGCFESDGFQAGQKLFHILWDNEEVPYPVHLKQTLKDAAHFVDRRVQPPFEKTTLVLTHSSFKRWDYSGSSLGFYENLHSQSWWPSLIRKLFFFWAQSDFHSHILEGHNWLRPFIKAYSDILWYRFQELQGLKEAKKVLTHALKIYREDQEKKFIPLREGLLLYQRKLRKTLLGSVNNRIFLWLILYLHQFPGEEREAFLSFLQEFSQLDVLGKSLDKMSYPLSDHLQEITYRLFFETTEYSFKEDLIEKGFPFK